MAADGAPSITWRADPAALLDKVVDGMGGERRDGQHALVAAVADALSEGHHLLAEAPTGSGKSLGYLVPAVASGLRVVVATSTIALQRQLISKDLPALAEHGDIKFSHALLKGRSNYLCVAKLKAAGAPDAPFELPVGADFDRQLGRLRTFAERSDTGDRGDLDVAVNNPAWAAVSCGGNECPGKANCDDGAACFAELARDNARDVSILVVNHALYCAHLASDGYVLPDHDVVILDEAHAFPENATNAFAGDITDDAITRLATMLRRAGAEREAVDRLNEAAKGLSSAIEKLDGTVHVEDERAFATALEAARLRLLGASVKLGGGQDDYGKRVARLAAGRLEVLERLASPGSDDVVWVERSPRTTRLRVAPVAAGETIAGALLTSRPVIAVSATLGGAPPFIALAAQMGLHSSAQPGKWSERDDDGRLHSKAGRGYVAVQTPSSFDWRAQGMLYVARDLPDPGRARDAWVEQAGDRICDLVNAAGGRALVLCTSHANVKKFAALLRKNTDHDILEQGDMEAGRLAEAFVEDEASVLVGTRSFWQGIDPAGGACVLVVIDRIPFPSPDDPLNSARRERAGQNAFAIVDLPVAALVLAQGAGRLLRTTADRGVVAVMDSRLALRDYRKQLLAAMPPLRRSVDVDEACEFLEEAAANMPVSPKPKGRASRESAPSDPRALRTDLPTHESFAIRNTVACPVCGAGATDRCHDDNGTSAFVHHGRVSAVAER